MKDQRVHGPLKENSHYFTVEFCREVVNNSVVVVIVIVI